MNTQALRPQELFNGPYVSQAPDLLVYFDDLYWRAGQGLANDSLYSSDTEIGPDDGVHDYDGIIVLGLPGQQRGEEVHLQLMDVAPTVLKLLGVDVPSNFEGTPVV
jgi:predicted AlkP superfamily phosphohydrolase/phosphomutase